MTDKTSDNTMSASIDQVIEQAHLAFQLWRMIPTEQRAGFIKRLRIVIVDHQDELLRAIVEDTGKPITEVVNQEVMAALEMLKFFVKNYPRWQRDRHYRYWRPGFWTKSNSISFEPLGVILIIGPSNFPFSLPVMQACSALLLGNSVVLKPSEKCPQTVSMIRRLFDDAKFPDEVIQIIEGAGEIAESMIAHEKVRKIVFTGSYATGKIIAEMCGRYLKPSVLELGGSGAAIVCDDVDPKSAARGITWSAFYSNGQSCVGTKRVFVHKNVTQNFIEELMKEIKSIQYGNPYSPTTEIGKSPLRKNDSYLQELILDAINHGGIIRTFDGENSDVHKIDFDKPVVVLNASASMQLTKEDIAAPIIIISEIHDDKEAVQKVNESPFGLSASVWCKDSLRAQTIARHLQVGMVWINDSSVGQPRFPWGGMKHSGWGRLFSREALNELSNIKVISHDKRKTSVRKSWWFPYSKEKYELFLSVNRIFFGAMRIKVLGSFVKGLWRYIRKFI